MKTEYEKSKNDLKLKGEKIKAFTEALEEHCESHHYLDELAFAMTELSAFMSELEGPTDDIVFDIKTIGNLVREHGDKEQLRVFEDLSETFIRGMILSGRNKEGISLIYQMSKDLKAIPELD